VIELRRVDAAGFAPYADASVEVFGAAMNPPASELRSRHEILHRHLQRRGFAATIGVDGEQLVGFGYAYPGEAGQWWHDLVAAALDPAAADQWLADSWEVVELHVRPERQGQGLGRRLLTALLTDAPGATALLSTGDRDSRARRLYRSMGFVELLTDFRFPGREEPYAVLGRTLPLSGARAASTSQDR